jgi:LAO/AO transport system kinase
MTSGRGRAVESPEALAAGVLAGDRRSLARAITLIESTRPDHRLLAAALLERLTPHAGNALRLGISGSPGVGKSTFIESLGNLIIDLGHRLAVLSVDPSSAISGGSILGDKTRMEVLARRQEAYIRPSPSGSTLGGVTRRTRESMLLCEASGFDVVIVETVGVGQSETRVAEMTDMFVLMLLPSGGDELQGIKRGIMELADLIVVNKADGDLAAAATRTAADYKNAIRLLHPRSENWKVPVLTCSSLDGRGVADVWQHMERYRDTLTASGELSAKRVAQARAWMWAETADALTDALRQDPGAKRCIPALEAAISEGKLPATLAAQRLLDAFLGGRARPQDKSA